MKQIDNNIAYSVDFDYDEVDRNLADELVDEGALLLQAILQIPYETN